MEMEAAAATGHSTERTALREYARLAIFSATTPFAVNALLEHMPLSQDKAAARLALQDRVRRTADKPSVRSAKQEHVQKKAAAFL